VTIAAVTYLQVLPFRECDHQPNEPIHREAGPRHHLPVELEHVARIPVGRWWGGGKLKPIRTTYSLGRLRALSGTCDLLNSQFGAWLSSQAADTFDLAST
jgi:hypothetical protein